MDEYSSDEDEDVDAKNPQAELQLANQLMSSSSSLTSPSAAATAADVAAFVCVASSALSGERYSDRSDCINKCLTNECDRRNKTAPQATNRNVPEQCEGKVKGGG